jgi:hypothetical protein
MLSIAIHISSVSLSIPSTTDNRDVMSIDKVSDDNHQTNGFFGAPVTTDNDIPLASLLTARCGFGITSTNDTIFAVGMFELISKIFIK